MMTTLTIPEKVPSNNGAKGLLRMHWSRRGKLRDTWAWLFRAQTLNRHTGKVTIHFQHYYTGRSISDPDNLYSTMKIPLDSLKKAGIIVDDKIEIIGHPTFEQIPAAGGRVRTVITITDL